MSRKWTAHKFIQVSATVDNRTDWTWCADCDHYSSLTNIHVIDRGMILNNMCRGAKSMWTDVPSGCCLFHGSGLISFIDTWDRSENPTLCQLSLSRVSGFPSVVWRSLTNMTSTAPHHRWGWTGSLMASRVGPRWCCCGWVRGNPQCQFQHVKPQECAAVCGYYEVVYDNIIKRWIPSFFFFILFFYWYISKLIYKPHIHRYPQNKFNTHSTCTRIQVGNKTPSAVHLSHVLEPHRLTVLHGCENNI